MPALVVLALLVVPLIELYLLIQVGQALGALPTIALLLVMSLLGAYLLRREGTRTWQALRTTLQSGRMPAREVADGALVILGGALLLTPGFFTDVVGLLLILPPTRAAFRGVLTKVVASRLGVTGVVGGLAADQWGRRRPTPGSGPRDNAGSGPRGSDRVVDGEVVDPPDTSPP